MRTVRRFLLPLLLVVVLLAAVFISTRPAVVRVDTTDVTKGTLLVTVEEDGRTRVKDRYIVFSPLAGQMDRITLKEGDPIVAGQTIIARIEPSDPALLDARAEAEADARVKAARANVERAKPQLDAALAGLEFAQNELKRVQTAAEGGGINVRELDDAGLALTMRTQEVRAAEFTQQIAAFELEQAEAALLRTRPGPANAEARFSIPSPINGRVLRVLRDSAGIVMPGTPLLEVGDPSELEIEVDVLSADAVRINAGDHVLIERWGGENPLNARVRVVEPSGYTKISALGVEEQRVDVILDFVTPPEERAGLADGYRVDARIIIDEVQDAVLVPSGALFRHDGSWGVFLLRNNRAILQLVEIGARNDRTASIHKGLSPGDRVIEYPSDRVRDGVRVQPR